MPAAVMTSQIGLEHSQWLRVHESTVSVTQPEGAAFLVQ